MVFSCAFCAAASGRHARRSKGRFKVTAENIAGTRSLLKQKFGHDSQAAEAADRLEVDQFTCKECLSDDLRSQLTRRQHGKLTVGALLTGRAIIHCIDGDPRAGTVGEFEPGSGQYEIKWSSGKISWLSEAETAFGYEELDAFAAEVKQDRAKVVDKLRKQLERMAGRTSMAANHTVEEAFDTRSLDAFANDVIEDILAKHMGNDTLTHDTTYRAKANIVNAADQTDVDSLKPPLDSLKSPSWRAHISKQGYAKHLQLCICEVGGVAADESLLKEVLKLTNGQVPCEIDPASSFIQIGGTITQLIAAFQKLLEAHQPLASTLKVPAALRRPQCSHDTQKGNVAELEASGARILKIGTKVTLEGTMNQQVEVVDRMLSLELSSCDYTIKLDVDMLNESDPPGGGEAAPDSPQETKTAEYTVGDRVMVKWLESRREMTQAEAKGCGTRRRCDCKYKHTKYPCAWFRGHVMEVAYEQDHRHNKEKQLIKIHYDDTQETPYLKRADALVLMAEEGESESESKSEDESDESESELNFDYKSDPNYVNSGVKRCGRHMKQASTSSVSSQLKRRKISRAISTPRCTHSKAAASSKNEMTLKEIVDMLKKGLGLDQSLTIKETIAAASHQVGMKPSSNKNMVDNAKLVLLKLE